MPEAKGGKERICVIVCVVWHISSLILQPIDDQSSLLHQLNTLKCTAMQYLLKIVCLADWLVVFKPKSVNVSHALGQFFSTLPILCYFNLFPFIIILISQKQVILAFVSSSYMLTWLSLRTRLMNLRTRLIC